MILKVLKFLASLIASALIVLAVINIFAPVDDINQFGTFVYDHLGIILVIIFIVYDLHDGDVIDTKERVDKLENTINELKKQIDELKNKS